MDLFETLGLGPRQSEENELYLAIYVDPPDTEDNPTDLAADPAPSDEAPECSSRGTAALPVEDRVEALRARCTAWLLPYTTDYVWHKDPLVLRASSRQSPPWERRRGPGRASSRQHAAVADAPPGCSASVSGAGGAGACEGCVWAVMRFGDAVDDEWWAVWLLLRMTRELQDLSVQVWDNDGQFLLIEAAYALPRWLKPEMADNRVWLRRGRLHIIPLPSAAAPDLPASPSAAQALAVLREGRIATASQRVQRPIDERLAGYPGRARAEQQHEARCLLPVPLAAALRTEPQRVSELVEAFYLRDAEDMRAAARMRVLPPSLPRLSVLVRMTRCHYAQLAQQRFSAPRGWPMPPPDSPLAKAADLGLKLTVAAEIICSKYPQSPVQRHEQQQQQQDLLGGGAGASAPSGANAVESSVTVSTTRGDAEAAPGGSAAGSVLSEARFGTDPGWRRFKASLESNGYFQGNIPGSRRYKELLASALEAYAVGLPREGAGSGGDVGGPSPADGARWDPRRRLATLVMEAASSGLRAESLDDGPTCSLAEDDDTWLDLQPDVLQAELERRQAELHKHASRQKEADTIPGAPVSAGASASMEVDADEIATKLRGFMEQLSGLEGVETRGEAAAAAAGDVDFNPVGFLRELKKLLDANTTGGDDVENEDEEEGGTSSEEGSSFFSSDDDSQAASDEEADEVAAQMEARVAETAGLYVGNRQAPKASTAPTDSVHPATTAAATAITTRRGAAQDVDRKTSTRESCTESIPRQPHPALKPGFLSRHSTVRSSTGIGGAAPELRAAPSAPQPHRVPKPASGRQPGSACVAAGIDGQGAAGGSSSRSCIANRQLDWEVRTATDSDDEERGDWSSDSDLSSEGGGPVGRRESDEEGDATVKLLAALGVESRSSETDRGDDDGDTAAGHRGFSDPVGQSGLVPGAGSAPTWRQRRSRSSAQEETAGPGRPEVSNHAPATGRGDGGGGGGRGDGGGGGGRDGDDGFMPLYDSAMHAELAGTTLAKSFDFGLGGVGVGLGREAQGGVAEAAGGSGGRPGGFAPEAAASSEGQDLQPVNLDMNLVRNLLRSYTAQQGSAGPAGNIAAMLGLPLVAGDLAD